MENFILKQELGETGIAAFGGQYNNYSAAVADGIDNSMGANASIISLYILIDDVNHKDENQKLVIKDNGDGFSHRKADLKKIFDVGGKQKKGGINQYGIGSKTLIAGTGSVEKIISYQKGSNTMVNITGIKDKKVYVSLEEKDDKGFHLDKSGTEFHISGKRLDDLQS